MQRLILICLLWATSANAQIPIAGNEVHFGVEDGLPQSLISDIYQDSQGFMWFSTFDGLSRYDGRRFRNFLYDPDTKNGLSGNSIYNILPFGEDQFTLLYNGIWADDMDPKTLRVRRNTSLDSLGKLNYARSFIHLRETAYNGKRWLFLKEGYKGIGWLNVDAGTVQEANRENGLLQRDSIGAVFLTADNTIYLISPDGVQVLKNDKKPASFIPLRTGIKPVDLQNARDTRLFMPSTLVLQNGHLALLLGPDLIIMDLVAGKLKRYPVPKAINETGADYNPKLKLNHLGQLYFQHRGRIFLMKEEGQLKQLWEYKSEEELPITAFYIDRSNVLWASASAKGLIKVDLNAKPFNAFHYKTNFVQAILQQAGLEADWAKNAMAYQFRYAYENRSSLYLSCNLLNNNNLYHWDGYKTTAELLFNSPTLYWAVANEKRKGIRVFEGMLRQILSPGNKAAIGALNPSDFNNMEATDALYLGGYCWMPTTSSGLFQLKDNKLVHKYAGNGLTTELTQVCADPLDSNIFWIGSRGGGLIKWHVARGLQRVFTTADGLPNNTVYCILPDEQGGLWCSTNKGLFRLDLRTNVVRSFDKTDGLPGNEFNRAHKFLFPDGRMGFGGMDGFVVFNPADFNRPEPAVDAPLQITSASVNASGIEPGNLSAMTELELPHDSNNINISFAQLSYNQPEKTLYRYRLIGSDTAWVEIGTNNQANFAALSPGRYVLELNAANNLGLWSKIIRRINIRIRPPFWSSWMGYTLYALILAALIFLYVKYREGRLKASQQLDFEKNEKARLQELAKMKERFFGNVSHEFRTPLTLIVTPLDKILDHHDLDEETGRYVRVARTNASRLSRLINEFLDISKLDSGQMTLRMAVSDLDEFVRGIVEDMQVEAGERELQLIYINEQVEGLYNFDEEKLEKILLNLLSNALKFTPAAGAVSVVLSLLNDRVSIAVRNTGPGIAVADQSKVFDRYYQAENAVSRGGTGIGLALVKDLVELMHGNIVLKSSTGITEFTLSLPLTKAPVADEVKVSEKAPVVMVVEDSDELRAFLVQNLGKHYQIAQAADGVAAWDIILTQLPDVIISDVMMPGRDGFALCELVKRDARTAHIPFILLTTRAAHEARIAGLRKGADDYVTKPFHLDELELRIANQLALQEKTRALLRKQLLPPAPVAPSIVEDAFLKGLYAELDLKLDDPELDVDALCRAMAMSRSTLNRKLKALLDITTNEFIKQYRLQKAAELLRSGSDIAGVAYQVGFSSPSYFSQCFKEQFGVTPTEFAAG